MVISPISFRFLRWGHISNIHKVLQFKLKGCFAWFTIVSPAQTADEGRSDPQDLSQCWLFLRVVLGFVPQPNLLLQGIGFQVELHPSFYKTDVITEEYMTPESIRKSIYLVPPFCIKTKIDWNFLLSHNERTSIASLQLLDSFLQNGEPTSSGIAGKIHRIINWLSGYVRS